MIRFTLLTTFRIRSYPWDPAVFLCLVHHRRGVAGEGGHSSSPSSETLSSAERIYLLATTMLRILREGMQDRPRTRLGSLAVIPSSGRQPLEFLGFSRLTRCLVGVCAPDVPQHNLEPVQSTVGGGYFNIFCYDSVGVMCASVCYVAVRAVIVRDINPHCTPKTNDLRYLCPMRSHLSASGSARQSR